MRRGLALLLVMFASAGEAAPEVDANVSVSLSRGPDGAQRVRCGFWIPAGAQQVWEVLSDYEALPRFAPSLVSSKVMERHPGRVLLEQRAMLKVLVFSHPIQLTLEVTEQPRSLLRFTDTAHTDFSRYVGAWRLVERDQGTWVFYSLEALPRFKVPQNLTHSLMKQSALELALGVRQEIQRRAANTP